MRWRRDERDTGDGVTCLGDNLVNLKARQLSALTRFCSLCHLNLYLLGIHQVLGGYTETSTGNLLGLRAQAYTVNLRVVAGVVLTTLTGVTAGAQLVHGQCQCLVGLDAQGTETHGTCNKMLNNAFYALNLVDWGWLSSLLESEEVADKDGALLLVNQFRPLLELFVVTLTGSQLQLGNGLGVPGVLNTILTPCKLTLVLQQCLLLGSRVKRNGIAGNLLQAHTTDGAHLGTEVAAQQILAQSDALKDLGTAVATDGTDTHLTHNLLQTLVHGLDVVLLGGGVLLLNLVVLHQIVEYRKCHVWAQGAGSVTQQQGCVHYLANLTALNNQSCLHTLTYANQVVVNSTNGQQRWDGGMGIVQVAVAQDNVVHTLIYTGFGLVAQVVQSLAQAFLTLGHLKHDRQLLGVEALVADVTKYIKLCVG